MDERNEEVFRYKLKRLSYQEVLFLSAVKVSIIDYVLKEKMCASVCVVGVNINIINMLNSYEIDI